MTKYIKFENAVVNTYKRGLMDLDEAINKIFGYLKCMLDMDIIESDRATEEMERVTKRLLDSK